MPLFDGTLAAAGLSEPPNMSGPLGKPALQYSGAYFTYDARAKEGLDFSSPWTTRTPVGPYVGAEGPSHHLIYRQDSNSSDEGQPHPASLHPVVVKQGFALYAKSPGIGSPTSAASMAIRKQKLAGENCSPKPDGSVYLAIPKPVYGHSACCHELGCVTSPRYAAEHAAQRIPNAVYEHGWMAADAGFGDRPHLQRKQDPVLQHRGLQFEPSPEHVKRTTLEAYGRSRGATLPLVMEPSYSSYPCSPAGVQFAPLGEQNKRLQTSPRDYGALYPAPPTYEHMTSEAHREHSPMSKYGRLTQQPMFYYPQASVEIESRTQCKDTGRKQREDIPVVVKQAVSSPRDTYIVPQSLHGEIPETLPNHSFTQSFEYPCYAVPRGHLSAGQVIPPLKRHHALPGLECMNVSVSNQHMHHPLDSAATLPKNKHSSGLRGDHSHHSPSFLSAEQTSPRQGVGQSNVLHSNMKMNRFFTMNRGVVDYGPCEVQVACHRPPKELPPSPVAWLPRSPNPSESVHAAAANGMNLRTIVYSPAVAAGNKVSGSQSNTAHIALKGGLKRSASSFARGQEDGDLDGMDSNNKRPKTVIENAKARTNTASPPMPVIGNVFSLAPYQAYLQTPGVLVPGRGPPRPVQSSEHQVVRPTPCLPEKRPDRDVVKVCGDAPAERPVQQVIKPKSIKAETVPQAVEDTNASANCHKTIIKTERDASAMWDSRTMSDVAKCEPAEPENGCIDEKICCELAGQDAPHGQSPDSKHNFRNIPPRCLKLSTYKILLPHSKHVSESAAPQEKPPVLMGASFPPKQLHLPVRQHFFDLHRSLCKLLFRSVSASSEQKLRAWLSKLELSEQPSAPDKVQKVSCLLGKKLREEWLSEEIKPALQVVLARLREYTIQERCPFPHVMRTGAVFLPMLVVKELLFPMVQSSHIDQVLQEHRVELRPTTLSEEKILIQLHKRACSSRLRRLMSLKHLPDVYTDVLNLLYYAYVCKRLEVGVASSLRTEHIVEESTSCGRGASLEVADSPASPSDGERNPGNNKAKDRTESRVKSSSRRVFLDDTSSDAGEAHDTGKTQRGSTENSLRDECDRGENRGSDAFDSEPASENSWTRPLTIEDLSAFESDTEKTKESGMSKSQLGSRTCSGVVLKLRKMFGEGMSGKKARYQTITDSGSGATSISCAEATRDQEAELHRRRSRLGPRWRRTTNFHSSRRTQKPLVKIKYCPYLSACHSAEHRRRWVLRSAVQRARRVMRFYYPDLVGKKIHHLYEEVDKSEVWYRGEVVRIHEAHSNPLKTIFEVRYDSEPEWKYYLELLMDYKKGWLKIED